MKQYGAMKATEFSKKQINVIWAKAKDESLKVEKWFMQELYNLADYYGYDDNNSVADSEREVLEILANVFENKIAEAQSLIDTYTNEWFSLFSRKKQEKIDRTIFVI